MTKDNILFSIIGVLLGVIAGYVFATTVNQSGYTPRRSAAAQAEQDSGMPPDQSSLPSKAVVEHGAGESSADAAAIEQAEAAPNDFEAQMKAAAIHYQNRRFKEAIAFLTRANQLRPDSYEAIVALGNANFDVGQYETAEKWYVAALVKKPDDINVRTDLGLTFLFREQQDVERAVKEFRRSLEINPRHEQTLQNMVVALVKKGSYSEAEATLDKLQQVNPGNPSLTKLRSDLEAGRASSKQPAAASRQK